jgi:hypothetical protein
MLAEGTGLKKIKHHGSGRLWEGTFSKAHIEYDDTRCQGVEWTLASTGNAFDIGLNRTSNPLVCRDPKTRGGMDFCMHMGALGVLRIFEDGVEKFAANELLRGNMYAVKVTGRCIEYICNAVVIYKSMNEPNFPLRVQTAFRHPGGKATGLSFLRDE